MYRFRTPGSELWRSVKSSADFASPRLERDCHGRSNGVGSTLIELRGKLFRGRICRARVPRKGAVCELCTRGEVDLCHCWETHKFHSSSFLPSERGRTSENRLPKNRVDVEKGEETRRLISHRDCSQRWLITMSVVHSNMIDLSQNSSVRNLRSEDAEFSKDSPTNTELTSQACLQHACESSDAFDIHWMRIRCLRDWLYY